MTKLRLRAVARIAAVVGGFAVMLAPQVQTKSFFAAVSIKPVDPRGNRGPGGVTMTAGFQPAGKFTAVDATLHMLIIAAYRGSWPLETGSQALKVDGGDLWTRTDGYDIEARVQGDPSLDEMEQMLRTVLVERFALKTHEETQLLPVYNLVMARKDGKPGPHLLRSVGPCVNTPASAPPDPGGLPHCADRFKSRSGAGLLLADVTMDQLAVTLMRTTGAAVYNHTGLAGAFDVDATIENIPMDGLPAYNPCPQAPLQNGPSFACPPATSPASASLRSASAGGSGGPRSSETVFDAMPRELGLKLESTKGPGDVIVIDRAERPLMD
jgi:uncharacterized protein (TIGR03435 family)